MTVFAPGDFVQAKRRPKLVFEVVRKVGDVDLYEVKGHDRIVGRHFYGTDLAKSDAGEYAASLTVQMQAIQVALREQRDGLPEKAVPKKKARK